MSIAGDICHSHACFLHVMDGVKLFTCRMILCCCVCMFYIRAVPVCPAGISGGMGNLLKVLSKDDNTPKVDIFLDFENAQPTESEHEVHQVVERVLSTSHGLLIELQQYKGADNEIREAISNPSRDDLQEKAWRAVCPSVVKLKKYYEYSTELENVLPQLLQALCSGPYTPTQHLERQQALAKQFAEILHFTLKFDDLKDGVGSVYEVSSEVANRMSLFYAEATPMLKTLSEATTRFVSENKHLPIENTTDCLSTMAAVCKVMLETPEYYQRFENEETILFCLRVMVGVIILYDHVHPVGAFAKKSGIDMKGCIKVLRDQPASKVEGLLNALRYTTKHLNDETTPKNIRALLA
ncbi:Protein fam49b [Branchiostoma belcheri]|nr:Protein fam49b [Branchiostoma belcheri]